MSVDGLRRELLAVPGVADAVVDDSDGTPRVRVVLAPDAVAGVVGAAVQGVLATHGISSRFANGSRPPVQPAPPAPPAPSEHVDVAPAPGEPVVESTMAIAEGPVGDLATLSVEESAGEILVVATSSDGRRFSRRSTAAGPESVAAAVVAVVGTLVDGRAPQLLGVWFAERADSEVVTVVLQRRDGSRHAGAAVVRVGRPYAVARAVWAALRE